MDFSHMTLREKVLQTFIVTIREINRHGGPEDFFSVVQGIFGEMEFKGQSVIRKGGAEC